MKEMSIITNGREQMIDITSEIDNQIKLEKVKNGFVYMYCPHTTAGLTINENADPDVQRDILLGLADVVRENPSFMHSEGNSTAHIKSTLVGKHLQIAIESGEMCLGTWDGIYFCEFDGPRNRKMLLKFLKDNN